MYVLDYIFIPHKGVYLFKQKYCFTAFSIVVEPNKLAADYLVYTQGFPAIRYIFHTYYYVSEQDFFYPISRGFIIFHINMICVLS
nr:MAG TPA: hypothetical protein [Caudoviricetes sp.]